jgi:hypothetical protein
MQLLPCKRGYFTRAGPLLLSALLIGLVASRGAAAIQAPSVNRFTLGTAVVALNGPWKFHVGDDPLWADPNFDDSSWESVDLTPPAGAHDGDVGLTGYVPGWQKRGHRGYSGYAWYRMRIVLDAPPGESLALSGPPYVDSAYQVFVDGRLMGGFGDFSAVTPRVYGIHRPKLFALDDRDFSLEKQHTGVVALRVWLGPWMLADPNSGGVYIAPSLGTSAGALARFQTQQWEAIRGYIVDAAEGSTFLFLALVVCVLIPFDRNNPAYGWMALALVIIGVARANQAVFFWWQFESYQEIEIVTGVLMTPLGLGAWTMAWYHWTKQYRLTWLPAATGCLTLTLMLLAALRRSWFYGVFPASFETGLRYCSMSVRFIFLTLTLLILFRSLVQPGREKWLNCLAITLISVSLFAQELSLVGVPGIWFPFGVGVSRSEFANAIFYVALIALLLQRLYSFRGISGGHAAMLTSTDQPFAIERAAGK